ncbi:MAG TPA: SRPBCC family protein [Ktedonobacteraceae bacterium]|jgi:hypothetical protein|nr:SRPBCC family protein [Ktedonobacteraceae bacterium]
MVVSVCPADIVAAPVEVAWELLNQPAHYGEWVDARVERVEPEGPATPGQRIYMTSPAFGKRWNVNAEVKAINPARHQVQIDVMLPLGLIDHATITCTAIDATSCRVQFG